MIPAAGFSAFLVGAGMWRALVATQSGLAKKRGWWVGALVGVLSHPFAWTADLLLTLSDRPRPESIVGEVLNAPLAGLGLSIASVMVLGWLTLPVGIVVGMIAEVSERTDRA